MFYAKIYTGASLHVILNSVIVSERLSANGNSLRMTKNFKKNIFIFHENLTAESTAISIKIEGMN